MWKYLLKQQLQVCAFCYNCCKDIDILLSTFAPLLKTTAKFSLKTGWHYQVGMEIKWEGLVLNKDIGFLKGPIYELSGFPKRHLMHQNHVGDDNGEIPVKATITRLRYLL